MYGESAGVEPADSSSEGNPLVGLYAALRSFQETAKHACDLGEHKLQREAEDASARCIAHIKTIHRAFEEGERCREGVHGKDPEAAQVGESVGTLLAGNRIV